MNASHKLLSKVNCHGFFWRNSYTRAVLTQKANISNGSLLTAHSDYKAIKRNGNLMNLVPRFITGHSTQSNQIYSFSTFCPLSSSFRNPQKQQLSSTSKFYNVNSSEPLHSSPLSTCLSSFYSSSIIPPSSSPQPSPPSSGIKDRVKNFFKEHGKTGLLVYSLISVTTYLSIYGLIKAGVDVKSFLSSIGIHLSSTSEKASTYLLAYLIYKIFLPLRLTIALTITPFVTRQLKAWRWIK